MMTQQAGVRTVVVGGRPEPGPMQAASGSRGALAYSGDYIDADMDLSITANPDLASVLPALDNNTRERDSGMFLTVAGLNLRDQVRTEAGGPPLQFTYEAADCRLYWTLDNALNMTRLWSDAAGAMWPELGLDARCVPGSEGYASHGKDATATKAAPENRATGVATLLAVTWNYDTSPSEAEWAGLEDKPLPEDKKASSKMSVCSAGKLNTVRSNSQNVCQPVQVVCDGGKEGTQAYFYIKPCVSAQGCEASLYCDTSYSSSPESSTYQQLGNPGGTVSGASFPQAQGYCIPKPGSPATKLKGLGCPL